MNSHVAVTKWHKDDGISTAIIDELNNMGYPSEGFLFNMEIPSNKRYILSFAPHGRIGALTERVAAIPCQKRPILIHWNFESLPDIRIPWTLLSPMSQFRAWFDRGLNKRKFGKSNGLLSDPLNSLNLSLIHI